MIATRFAAEPSMLHLARTPEVNDLLACEKRPCRQFTPAADEPCMNSGWRICLPELSAGRHYF
jgi:hypothetical protein